METDSMFKKMRLEHATELNTLRETTIANVLIRKMSSYLTKKSDLVTKALAQISLY